MATTAAEDTSGQAAVEMTSEPSASSTTEAVSEGALLRIMKIATAVLTRSGGRSKGEQHTEAFVEGQDSGRARLTQTLQQVAIHRVQQIHARLNGVEALEKHGSNATVSGSGEQGGDEGDEEGRLESEARGLVAFACASAIGCSTGGGRRAEGEGSCPGGAWGDEDEEAKCSASWRMMMPYLPVWIGLAESGQV